MPPIYWVILIIHHLFCLGFEVKKDFIERYFKEISAQDKWIESNCKVTYKHAYKLNLPIKHKYSAYKHMLGGSCIREFSGVVLVQRNLFKVWSYFCNSWIRFSCFLQTAYREPCMWLSSELEERERNDGL